MSYLRKVRNPGLTLPNQTTLMTVPRLVQKFLNRIHAVKQQNSTVRVDRIAFESYGSKEVRPRLQNRTLLGAFLLSSTGVGRFSPNPSLSTADWDDSCARPDGGSSGPA